MRIEQILFRDLDEPEKYNFFLMRQCTCHKEWKTIGVERGNGQDKIMKGFRYVQPIEHIPDNQYVILYSME